MHSYAQTNIQLFNQLRRDGYSKADLDLVRDAYELAMALFTGRFQPSGKPFIAHVVGTASILASLRLPAPLVAVGLLHNVYLAGDFGDGRHSITTTRREKIRRVLGREAEEYVARFPSLNWKSPTVQRARNNPEKLDSADRNVLLILMADHLEHLLNLDLLYYQDRVRRSYLRNCTLAVETAQSLGLTALAAEVKQGIQETESAELPVEFPVERIAGAAFVIVPKSCRKRLSVTLRQTLIRGLHRVPGMSREILRALGYQESPRLVKRAFQAQRDRVIRWIRKRKLPKGSLRPNSEVFQNLFPRTASLKRVATGFRFTEGPVWMAEKKSLLFSDIPANRIYELAADGHVMTVREPSGNSNGLTRDQKGRLIACEHGNRRVTRTEADGAVTVLAETFRGKRLNSPNDVVVKSDGAIYFTDPSYGIKPEEQEQPVQGVYRLSADGSELTLVADDFARPNGLAFSPDEKKLYIDDSHRRHIRVCEVRNDGSLSRGSLFHAMDVRSPGSPDGMKIDVEGRVYCTGAGGVWVFDDAGKHLGTIVTPEKPSNCAWGDDDWCSLYITAVTSVYRIRVKTPGLRSCRSSESALP